MKNLFRRALSLVLTLCMLASIAAFPVFAADLENITDIDVSSYGKIYFKGETNKDFAKYEVGEEMVFTFTLWADNQQICAPYFKCTVSGDDGKSFTEIYDATSGSVTLKTSVSVAGGVRVEVEPADWSKKVITADNLTKFEGGAIAGATTVQTTVTEPLDFDEYWAGKLAELDECAPNLFSLEPITSNNASYDAYVVKVDCIGVPSLIATNATWTAGILSIPKNAAPGSLGFYLTFQGYGVNSAGQSNNSGYVTFAVCAHSMEQLQASSYYNKAALGLDSYGWSTDENSDPDTSYYTYMLLRDVQAVRFLKKYFGTEGGEASFNGVNTGAWKGLWNGRDIVTHGGSQGGFQAISVGALVPEVTKVSANVPWFADVAGNTVSTRIKSTFRPPYADGLRYLDTALMAKRVKANVSITAGTGDTLCPMYAVQAIYNNVTTNASLTFTQGKCHSSTNTFKIDSVQQKSASTESQFGTNDICFVAAEGALPAGYIEEFSDAWRRLTGRDAVIYTDYSDYTGDSLICVEFFDVNEIAADPEGIDADFLSKVIYGTPENGVSSMVLEALKAAADPESKVYLLSYGEEMPKAGEIAENISGAVYGNLPDTNPTYKIIDENGKECSSFVAADDLSAAEVYPIAYPYYKTKDAGLSVSYSSPEVTGEDYGVITVRGKNMVKNIKVFAKDSIAASGNDSGNEWIVQGSAMNIYGEDITDTEYDWNSAMSGVTEIIINDGVTRLGAGAFDVPAGASVTLPLSLDYIDSDAFCGNTDFTIRAYKDTVGNTFANENGIAFVSLGEAKKCGENVYWKFEGDTLTIFGSGTTVQSGITGFGKQDTSVFYEHYNDIKKIVIGGDITTLGTTAFHYMPNLTTVELSPNVTRMNQAVFETCWNLSTIYVTGNEPVVGTADLSNITTFAAGYIFDGVGKIKNYILSDELTSKIYKETFKSNTFSEITVPEGVTEIEALTFSGASALKTVTVLGKNTVINGYAFASMTDTTNAKYTNYAKNVTIVAYENSQAHEFAKSNLTKFKNIETDEIIDYASYFAGDSVLNGAIGAEGNFFVSQIDDTDTYELTITASGASLDASVSAASQLPYAEYADRIVSVKVNGNVAGIGDYIFAEMPMLEIVELSGSITALGNSTFENSGVRTIYISDTTPVEGKANLAAVTSFGTACFAGTAFESVTMSGSITTVPAKAFMGSGLTSLALSAKITAIEADAFKNCASLASVTFASKQFTIANGAFAGLASDAVISAYEDTAAEKMANQNGYTFDSMGEIPHTIEGEIVGQYWNNSWVFDEFTNVLTITANVSSGWNECGPLSTDGGLSGIIKRAEEVIIIGNIGKLSGGAFNGATNLKKVTIPYGLPQINSNAFANCPSLTTIALEGRPVMEGVIDFSNLNGSGGGSNSIAAGSNIFKGATAAKAIALGSLYSDAIPLIASNLPDNLETIYGSTEYLEKYCEENGLEFVPFGKDTSGKIYWTINTETETLTLFGEGSVKGLADTIDRYAATVKHVVIEKEITGLGNGALSKLTALEDVKLQGDAPTVVENAKPFGDRDDSFRVIVKGWAQGFDGETWCGYTLTKLNYIAGDLNEDSAVDTKDAVLLAQKLAGWNVEYHALAADCNGDGSVDTKDAVLLAQKLAGWDVELEGGSPSVPDEPDDPDQPVDPEDPTDESPDNEIDYDDIKIN